LSGFVHRSTESEDACYILSYQESGCYVDRAFPPHVPNLEDKYTCYGSNDTCGDSWIGFCDDSCQQSYCAPARQPQYQNLMRLTHYVCDVNGNWVAFDQYENAQDEDGDSINPSFSFDGTNVTKFTCELPAEREKEVGQGDSSTGNTGGTDGQRVVNGGGEGVSTGNGLSGGSGTSTGGGESSGSSGSESGSSGSESGSSGSGYGGGSGIGSGGHSQQSLVWNGVIALSIAVVLAFAAYLICIKRKHPMKSILTVEDRQPLLA